MYEYVWDEDNWREPSEFEEKIEELKDAMRDSVQGSIKDELEQLRKENARLSLIEKEMKESKSEYDKQARELEWKSNNLKSEIEREFYKKEIEDVFENIVKDCTLFFAEKVGHKQEKCELCDENREMVAEFPDGSTQKKDCGCNRLKYRFQPSAVELKCLVWKKRDGYYQSDREFYISKTYKPTNKNRRDYDYDYSEFSLQHIVDNFCNETIELHNDLGYAKRIGFRSEKECQKYCDWLNGSHETV